MIGRIAMWWVQRQVRTGLDGIYVEGLATLRDTAAQGPVVVACTHQSWWDGLIAVWLCQHLALTPTLVMDAKNLEAYPFFGSLGALGVKGTRGVRDALARLRGPGDVLWIFPQGGYTSPTLRPLELQRGAVWLASKAGCPVVPMALGYRHAEQPAVRAYVAIHDPVTPDREGLEGGLLAGLEALDTRTSSFEPAIAGVPIEVGLGTRIVAWVWRTVPWMR